MTEERMIRVLVARPGLDGNERGAQVMACGMRDAGFEVIYSGPGQSPEEIAAAAVQEDVDVLGLSIPSGVDLSLTRKVLARLKEEQAEDILLLVGGIAPDQEIAVLKEMGVAGVFVPGTPVKAIADFIRKSTKDRRR